MVSFLWAALLVSAICMGAIECVDPEVEYQDFFNSIQELVKETPPMLNQEKFYYGYDGDDLAAMSGFMIQHHNIETQDGYYLDFWRLNDAVDTLFPDELAARSPVIINPGLGCDGTIFMNNNRTNSIAYMMYDEGYDVWIINNRGNVYSRKHKTLSKDNEEFWLFSMHEQAKYDLVSSIDYVLKNSDHKAVTLMGHSMGSADIVVLMTMYKEFGFDVNKIRGAVLTAPATISEHMTAMMFDKIHDMEDGEMEKLFFKIFGYKCFMDHDDYGLLLSELCYRLPEFSYAAAAWACGEDSTHAYKPEEMYYYLNYYPSGTSSFAIAHYAQLTKRGGFQAYDYSFTDPALNIKMYGTSIPPTYDFNKIPTNIPILIVPGSTDTMASIEDSITLYNKLMEKQRSYVEMYVVEGYNHVDFMWGYNVGELVYPKIDEFLNKFAQ